MNSDQAIPPDCLAVAPIGLDNRQRAALEMVFKGQCRNAYRMVDDTSAQAWIVDLDHYHSGALIKEWESQGGKRPGLFLSIRDGAIATSENTLFLRKPFHLQDFVSIMVRLERLARLPGNLRPPPVPSPDGLVTDRVRVSIQDLAPRAETRAAAYSLAADQHHPFVGTAPDVDLEDPEKRDGVFYDPDHYLQGHVARAWRQAEASRSPMGLKEPWPRMRLCPDRGLAGLELDQNRLRPFASVAQPACRRMHDPVARGRAPGR